MEHPEKLKFLQKLQFSEIRIILEPTKLRIIIMFEEDFYIDGDDDLDDFDYYVSYIKALEEEQVSKGDIVRELMDEFDIEKDEAVKVLKKYLRRKDDDENDDEEEDDIVEDDDYGDGNREF